MKQIILIIFLAVLFVGCRKHRYICTGYTVDKNPCGCVTLQAKIGNDFDSALDSLKRQYESKFIELEATGFYSGKGYFIEKEKINVDFTDDGRAFFFVIFIDSVIIHGHLTNRHLNRIQDDVLDEKGNRYRYEGSYKK